MVLRRIAAFPSTQDLRNVGEAGGGDGDGNDGSSSRPELTRGQLLRISCGMLGLMFGWATKVVVIVMVVVVLLVVYVGNLNRQLWCCTSDGHQDRYLNFRISERSELHLACSQTCASHPNGNA